METLRRLFHIRSDDVLKEAEIELGALLRKLFVASHRIEIQRSFPGYSGAAVLLVQSDAGPEIILKCASKVDHDASDSDPVSHENAITVEVSNYNEFIQGKIRLNHNIIYPDTIRETRRLNGFVSSSVGSRLHGRRTLAEFAASDASPANFFRVLTEAVSQIIEEVWQWWYEKADGRSSKSVAKFLREGLHRDDIAWHVAAGRVTDLENLVYAAATALDYHLKKEESPVAIWERFQSWSVNSGEVQWQECVTHGDLHGGNVFLDPQSAEVWLIDFARTGKRASIFDLATLEAHIMFQLLPNLLKTQGLLHDHWAFVKTVLNIEEVLVGQRTYDQLILPEVRAAANPKAVEALQAGVRAVINIRRLLHDALGRRGKITDYLVVLFLQSFRYMNVRGASDAGSSNLGVLLAALASNKILSALMRTDEQCTYRSRGTTA